jgi:hypothetical protein
MLCERHPRDLATTPGDAHLLALPSRAPLPRPRTVHDRTLVVRRAHRRAAAWSSRSSRGLGLLLTSDQPFAAGLLLAWGLGGLLAHLWLAPIAPLA